MEKGAEQVPALVALKKSDAKAFEKAWKSLREDGAYVEAGENDNVIVQKLEANRNAFGIFGFSFLDENSAKLRGVSLDGTEPTYDNIAGGKYKGSRPLFVYIKKQHVGMVPGVDKFAAEYVSNKALGEDGYLAKKGLVTLPKAQLEAVRKDVTGMVADAVAELHERAQDCKAAAPAAVAAACRDAAFSLTQILSRSEAPMGLVYFTGLALLIFVGYLFGRSRAAAAGRDRALHSRPAYHGAFVVISVLVPVLLIFVVAVPVADRIVETQALTAFDPSVVNDPLRRGAALRDIEAVASGKFSGEPSPALAPCRGNLRRRCGRGPTT